MKVSRALVLGPLCIVLFAVSVSAWATRSDSAVPVREDTEVVFGGYHCGAGGGQAYTWVTFQATGDLTPDYLSAQRNLSIDGEPREICGSLVSGALRIVQAAGCTAAPRETRTDETGVSIDLQFICHDQRSRLTQILADLGGAVLLSAP